MRTDGKSYIYFMVFLRQYMSRNLKKKELLLIIEYRYLCMTSTSLLH